MTEDQISAMPTLTPRERAVLELVAVGLTAKEIGQHLGISPRTAGHHLDRACDRLGAANSVNAVAIAIQIGLIRP